MDWLAQQGKILTLEATVQVTSLMGDARLRRGGGAKRSAKKRVFRNPPDL